MSDDHFIKPDNDVEPKRKPGRSRLVYDKAKRTIVEMSDTPRTDVALHKEVGDPDSMAVTFLARTLERELSDLKKSNATHADMWAQAERKLRDRDARILELEWKLAALQKTNAMLADNWTNTERLLRAAGHALRSYQYGNGAADLAVDMANKIDAHPGVDDGR